jgi:hypothetical protein
LYVKGRSTGRRLTKDQQGHLSQRELAPRLGLDFRQLEFEERSFRIDQVDEVDAIGGVGCPRDLQRFVRSGQQAFAQQA